MGKFRDIIEKIPSTKENMQELTEITEKAMESLMRSDKTAYDYAMHELEEIAYEISKEKAESIVRAMKPTDKTVSGGEKWSYDTVKDFIANKGIKEKVTEYFITMNMFWNDSSATAKKYATGNEAEFCFDLAKDYINDIDGSEFKVQKYFL